MSFFSKLLRNKEYTNLIVPSIFMVLFSLMGLSKLEVNGDVRVFFDENDRSYQKLLDLEDEFIKTDTLIFVVDVSRGELFNRESLTEIHKLSEKIWAKPFVARVDSLTNFNWTISENDEVITSPLFEPDSNTPMTEIRNYAIQEERLVNGLLGKDGDTTSIVVTLDIDRANRSQVQSTVSWGEEYRAELERNLANSTVRLAGTVFYAHTLIEATDQEFSTKIPIVVLLMILIIYLVLRSIKMVFVCVYLILIANMITLGFAGWVGIPVTPIIAFVPITLFAIVLADAIHLITGYINHLSRTESRQLAKLRSLEENFSPMLITSITTAIGFLCINLSESPPYYQFGNLSALGSIVAFILTAMWLPTWITLFDVRKNNANYQIKILNISLVNPKMSVLLVGTVAVIFVSNINKNYLDERVDKYFDDTWEIKHTNELINDKLTGVHKLQYRVPGTEDLPIIAPEYLRSLERFSQWAATQPNVADVVTFDEIVKTLNQQMHNSAADYYKIPDDQQLISQYLLLYEMSLPYGASIEHIVNFDKSATKVKVILYSSSSQEILQFERDAERWIQQNWPDSMQVEAISLEALFSRLNIDNSRSMIISSLIGFAIIAVILCFVTKSVSLGLLSVIPNLLPAITAFGLWGLKDGQIGLSVSIVTAITLGIVVDDTIHLISKYRRGSKYFNYSSVESARYALDSTGRAIFTTTLVLVCCFGVLSFSHFKPNADLGFLSAITLFLAFLIDIYLFLPLLVLFGKKLRV